jgi:hypothetical protein
MSFGWILVSLVVLGVAAVLGNAFVVSAVTGWSALFRQFPAGQRPAGAILRDCVLGIGPGPGLVRALHRSQTRIFGLLANADGLYLDAGSPNRFRWPPLLIPWREVELVATRNLFGKDSFELRLGRSTCYLTVTQPAFLQIAPFLK